MTNFIYFTKSKSNFFGIFNKLFFQMSMIKEGLTAFSDLYEKWQQKKFSTSSDASSDSSVPQ